MTTTHLAVDDETPRQAYVATEGQENFAIPFVFFSNDDILVYVNGEVVDDADYNLTGALSEDDDERLLIFDTGLSEGDEVLIVRDIPIALTSYFPTTGPFSISTLNLTFSKIVAMMQQLENSIERTLRLADSDPADNLTLPAADERANKFLAFNTDGDPVAASSVTGVPVSGFMETVLDDTSAAAARATLGVVDTSSYAGLSNWNFCR